LVYSAYLGDRTDSLYLTRAALGRGPARKKVQRALSGDQPISAFQPFSVSAFPEEAPPSPFSPLPSPALSAPRKVLVFRIGQLGDTIAALPAMWAIREHFKDAELTLLCDRHPDKTYVFGPDLLRGSGLFQHFDFYPVRDASTSRVHRGKDMLRLLARLKRAKFDTLVYLSPSARSRMQIARDVRFFRLAGVRNFIGTDGFGALPPHVAGQPLEETPHEAELLMARLAASGIPIPLSGHGSMDLHLGPAEEQEFQAWLAKNFSISASPSNISASQPFSFSASKAVSASSSDISAFSFQLSTFPFIAFAPGSKMPAKRWPLDRFIEVGQTLIDRFDIWPIIFGGAEDAADAERLLTAWGRGFNAAGQLSLRAAAVALKHCLFYLGNDTGTMHLAASVGTRCVAIFSARDWPGRWHPYGSGHRVLRAAIDCEGCGLVECVERKNECLALITAKQVIEACEATLSGLKAEDKLRVKRTEPLMDANEGKRSTVP